MGKQFAVRCFSLLMLGAVVCATGARAQGIPVIDAQAIIQWTLQAQAMKAQIEQAEMAAKSLQSQLQSSQNANQSGELQNFVNTAQQVNSTVGAVKGLSGSAANVANQINRAYGSDAGGTTPAPDFDTYMKTSKDTVRGSMVNNAVQLDNMSAEAARIDALANQSQGAQGALEAQQAGNQINAELVQQIQKQRQQQLVQAQADNAARLAEMQKQEANRKITGMFFKAPQSAQ